METRTRPSRRRTPKILAVPRAGSILPARPAHLREANCRTLLRLLRANSPCSKADLVRLSGLTAPTVALAVAQMSARGLVEPIGEGESSGGRPPALLRFNAAHGYVAAADIGGTRLRMTLADLNGTPVAHWATHMADTQKRPQCVVSLLHAGLEQMKRSAAIAAPILHLTAGAPGITDVRQGTVLAAPNLEGWNHVPLRNLLAQATGLPVTVENDTNLAAVGEYARGVASGIEDFVFVAIGTGVGAGIFLRGALHHGANWSAGEIGYLPIAGTPRSPVRMRETGQLERQIGGAGIEALWQQSLAQSRRFVPPELLHLRAPHIFDRAEDGDPRAAAVLLETARTLADALSTISLLYNPALLILGGGVGSHPALCRATEQLLRKNDFAMPPLRSSVLGTEAQLFGALALALEAAESKLLC